MEIQHFLSCDWGTSSFRLRLVEASGLKILAEVKSGAGIAETHRRWKVTTIARRVYYTSVIQQAKAMLAEQTEIALPGLPVVLSGMASSSVGLEELPYADMPFRVDGSDLAVHAVDGIIIISGVSSGRDVMRGEETKVVGCAEELTQGAQEQWLLLPGTHPKHVVVSGGRVERFRTFMTGEIYELLSKHSILSASVSNDSSLEDAGARNAFAEGVRAGLQGNLLHEVFMVRTNQLLRKIPVGDNGFYLSGLLIGAELSAVPRETVVRLVAGPYHAQLYTLACDIAGISVTAVMDADEALIRGQRAALAYLHV